MRGIYQLFFALLLSAIPITLSYNFVFPDDVNYDRFQRQDRRPQRQAPGGFQWGMRPNFGGNNPNSGRIIFPDDDEFPSPNEIQNDIVTSAPPTPPTSTVAVPGMGTRRPLCEENCPATPEYNPICGTDGATYSNPTRLSCAQRCGKMISISFYGACPRTG